MTATPCQKRSTPRNPRHISTVGQLNSASKYMEEFDLSKQRAKLSRMPNYPGAELSRAHCNTLYLHVLVNPQGVCCFKLTHRYPGGDFVLFFLLWIEFGSSTEPFFRVGLRFRFPFHNFEPLHLLKWKERHLIKHD